MRSALIIATFSLSILAAPVPEPEPIFKSNEIGQNDRPDLNSRVHQRDFQVEARSPTFSRNKNAREIDFEARSPINRRTNARSVDDEDDVETAESVEALYTRSASPEPFGRGSHPRSADPEPFGRGSHPRSADPEPFGRGSHPRSADPEPFGRGSHPRSADPEPFGRGSHPRSADQEMQSRDGEEIEVTDKRDAEPGYVRGPRSEQSKRTASPEPGYTRGPRSEQSKRTASPEPGYTRGPRASELEAQEKRDDAPEAHIHGNPSKRNAEAEAEPINRINGK